MTNISKDSLGEKKTHWPDDENLTQVFKYSLQNHVFSKEEPNLTLAKTDKERAQIECFAFEGKRSLKTRVSRVSKTKMTLDDPSDFHTSRKLFPITKQYKRNKSKILISKKKWIERVTASLNIAEDSDEEKKLISKTKKTYYSEKRELRRDMRQLKDQLIELSNIKDLDQFKEKLTFLNNTNLYFNTLQNKLFSASKNLTEDIMIWINSKEFLEDLSKLEKLLVSKKKQKKISS